MGASVITQAQLAIAVAVLPLAFVAGPVYVASSPIYPHKEIGRASTEWRARCGSVTDRPRMTYPRCSGCLPGLFDPHDPVPHGAALLNKAEAKGMAVA